MVKSDIPEFSAEKVMIYIEDSDDHTKASVSLFLGHDAPEELKHMAWGFFELMHTAPELILEAGKEFEARQTEEGT